MIEDIQMDEIHIVDDSMYWQEKYIEQLEAENKILKKIIKYLMKEKSR